MGPIATCPAPCGQRNRLKPGTTQRCGKCGHVFTPGEVLEAALGIPVPTRPPEPQLTPEEDGAYDDGADGDDDDE
jgi:hypothetical protein